MNEQRHPTLYLLGGDLVVSATSKGPENETVQLFRVHQAILACYSPVFKDMLAIRQTHPGDVYDGVPRLHLPDDAGDVAALLQALHNPSTLPHGRPSPDTAHKFYGVMNLAVKYEVTMVCTIIAEHVKAGWPRDLVEWEQQNHNMQKMLVSQCKVDWEGSVLDSKLSTAQLKSFPEPASAICFAMRFKCPDILPAAFYELARIKDAVEWDGADPSGHARPARWSLLNDSTLLRLARGKNRLHSRQSLMLSRLKDNVAKKCTGRRFINGEIIGCEAFVKVLLLQKLQSLRAIDPLGTLCLLDESEPVYSRKSSGDLDHWCCRGGCVALRETIREEATSIWEELSSFFDL